MLQHYFEISHQFASAKFSTGVLLNDTLLVGPTVTVHPPLINVLLHFRFYPIVLTAYISKMYLAVKLASTDRDLHRFVWKLNSKEPLWDYWMTQITFRVPASSFASNMAVKKIPLTTLTNTPSSRGGGEVFLCWWVLVRYSQSSVSYSNSSVTYSLVVVSYSENGIQMII